MRFPRPAVLPGAATGALAVALAAATLASTTTGALAQAADTRLEQLENQMRAMQTEIERLHAEQEANRKDIKDTRDSAVVTAGSTPGSFRMPGSSTEFTIGGYVKTDLILDLSESTGDVFVPESITTSGPDQQRFRAHARQSRLFVKTSTPTASGPMKTHLEADFFGGGGNEVFSNSAGFRLRHAYVSWNGILAGQTWSNFMPIESYPGTLDFNGPAGMPFIRQAQLRYTVPLSDNLTVSGSVENSEFSGRTAAGAFSESTNLGIRAGVDKAPDVTLAATWRDDWGLVKLATLGRYLDSPTPGVDGEIGWGVNLSGNAKLWEGGLLQGSFTYGDGVGRYIINGFSQDAFVDAAGNVNTIEAYGVTLAVRQQLTDTVSAGLAFGRYEVMDTFAATDLDSVNTVHASLFYKPIKWLTFGGEVIWGNREDANGTNDDAVRLQTSVQATF